jgi:hypothetical protein
MDRLDYNMKIFTLRTQLSLPFDHFKNLGCISGRLGSNKAWELEHTYYSGSLFDIDISCSTREDHAGFDFTLGLLGYGINFRIYDTRHWNYNLNRWEHYEYSETLRRTMAQD